MSQLGEDFTKTIQKQTSYTLGPQPLQFKGRMGTTTQPYPYQISDQRVEFIEQQKKVVSYQPKEQFEKQYIPVTYQKEYWPKISYDVQVDYVPVEKIIQKVEFEEIERPIIGQNPNIQQNFFPQDPQKQLQTLLQNKVDFSVIDQPPIIYQNKQQKQELYNYQDKKENQQENQDQCDCCNCKNHYKFCYCRTYDGGIKSFREKLKHRLEQDQLGSTRQYEQQLINFQKNKQELEFQGLDYPQYKLQKQQYNTSPNDGFLQNFINIQSQNNKND